jgi:hypothetical protein
VKGLTLNATPEEKPKTTLKRKVGYLNELVSATRARIAEMEIDDRMDIIEKESIERENRINEINQTKESES